MDVLRAFKIKTIFFQNQLMIHKKVQYFGNFWDRYIKILRNSCFGVDFLRTKWDGLIKKALGKYYKDGGVLYPMLDDNTEELDEATSVGSVGGQYETPKFWAKGKGNWRNRVKKAYPGGKFVNIKKKCKNYPYCDQGSGGR